MAGKRKRKRPGNAAEIPDKRQKISNSKSNTSLATPKDSVIKQALLTRFYSRVFTLREYLLERLPSSSKIRRKKVLHIGSSRIPNEEGDQELSLFLDRTLVGVLCQNDDAKEDRRQQWASLSQIADESVSTLIDLRAVGWFSQSEIVNKSIWMLMNSKNQQQVYGRAQHLLCHGFQKGVSTRMINQGESHISDIPGVISAHPNSHVTAIKTNPWPQVLLLLGREGDNVMADLIMDCGIFVEAEAGRGVYHQLSGMPLSELPILPKNREGESKVQFPMAKNDETSSDAVKTTIHSPSSIVFVRHRMLYARAEFNAQGGVIFGLRHIHVLNRYTLEPGKIRLENDSSASQGKPPLDPSTIRIMMYLFPRQFGLHNVFASEVDSRQTAQPYKDYTLREDEISEKYPGVKPKIPKRLRGKAVELVRKLQVQHKRCAYKKLLEHYCPINATASVFPIPPTQPPKGKDASAVLKTQNTTITRSEPASTIETEDEPRQKQPSMMDYATPTPMVSAFCRSVLSNIIPKGFWGIGETQINNEKRFLLNVDRFIEMRRRESFSLHEATQGLQISNIPWLQLPNCTDRKCSQSDTQKRLEIFQEFLYYTIDSLLIPLLRANFYITESAPNIHKNRLFYFRHDIWKTLSEPSLTSLKSTMFEEIQLNRATQILGQRKLGYSCVRLLPKESGVRPIMNLKRRQAKKGEKYLRASINSLLKPVYQAFWWERQNKPSLLGSTMFSTGDLYTRLKTFKSTLPLNTPLYFVKVDVQAAFDTIPQSAILSLMSKIPTESSYRLAKHVEIKPPDPDLGQTKPMKVWKTTAHAPRDQTSLIEDMDKGEYGMGRKNMVFVENIVSQKWETRSLVKLLKDHVQVNMVRIGKRYYRQKEGIPQGSVLSSLLCNYFYADLEAKHLSFLNEGQGESFLARMIDDFLLVTTSREKAKRFLDVMHGGDGLASKTNPSARQEVVREGGMSTVEKEYGVKCHPGKSLVNFEVVSQGVKLKRVVNEKGFPYCGSVIDMKTLNVSRDKERRRDMALADSLTVEFSKMPGKSFHRKVLTSFKIQSNAMYLDTTFNSLPTVLSNVHAAFTETAAKMWTYAKCLPVGKQPGLRLLISESSSLFLCFLAPSL
ncbi:hypothetical protein HYALB_00008677 [Hymenoscyphus albidus]|uniref:Telomerase reverse transcriptase n=1 Tax=Hymenoscyphus albidus TaxID=595503 RepID=A0A9N9LKF7_9HELO|nr:hypothetical protein HYALB_00008677 [Hymenoscyphus albidus]